jgi:chemotaxis receptor (MCP) glutamine deamidase CheD
MKAQPEQLIVAVDAFRVAKEQALLTTELQAALAVCVFDDTQAAGGMIHLRYVAPTNDQPLELTDNTLSSDLLLLDRFCKELRRLGARKQSWRVQVFAHIPGGAKVEEHAATVLDLIKAYFSDGRRPVECQEIRRDAAVVVRFDPREGRYWVHGSTGASPLPQRTAPASA